MRDVSDCIAMSEDGAWYAFPAGWTRGQVIGALAEDSDWWSVLHSFHVKQGHVHHAEVSDWWYTAAPGCECDTCTPCWIVTRR